MQNYTFLKELLDLKGNIIFDETTNQSKQLDTITKKRNLNKYTFGSSRSFIKIIKIQKLIIKTKLIFLLIKKTIHLKPHF